MGVCASKSKRGNQRLSVDTILNIEVDSHNNQDIENFNFQQAIRPPSSQQNDLIYISQIENHLNFNPFNNNFNHPGVIDQIENNFVIQARTEQQDDNIEEAQIQSIKSHDQSTQNNVVQDIQKQGTDLLNVQNQKDYEKLFIQRNLLYQNEQNNRINIEMKEIKEIMDIIIEQIINNDDNYHNNAKENEDNNKEDNIDEDQFLSSMTLQKYKCFKCGLEMSENFIMMDCTHNFHQECLNQIQKQKDKNQPYICLCKL